MSINYEIEKRGDARGAPVFFITGNGAELTSRWTRQDADAALAWIRALPTGKHSPGGYPSNSINGITASLLERMHCTPAKEPAAAAI